MIVRYILFGDPIDIHLQSRKRNTYTPTMSPCPMKKQVMKWVAPCFSSIGSTHMNICIKNDPTVANIGVPISIPDLRVGRGLQQAFLDGVRGRCPGHSLRSRGRGVYGPTR